MEIRRNVFSFRISRNGREIGLDRGINAKDALENWFAVDDLIVEPEDETPIRATIGLSGGNFTATWSGAEA